MEASLFGRFGFAIAAVAVIPALVGGVDWCPVLFPLYSPGVCGFLHGGGFWGRDFSDGHHGFHASRHFLLRDGGGHPPLDLVAISVGGVVGEREYAPVCELILIDDIDDIYFFFCKKEMYVSLSSKITSCFY